jgi:hypothetical protein
LGKPHSLPLIPLPLLRKGKMPSPRMRQYSISSIRPDLV